MIKDIRPLSMVEAIEYIKNSKEEGKDILSFIKKFTKLNSKEAKELRKKIEELDLMKISNEYLIKIIDILPENPEELNKIFVGVSLDEEEAKKILEVIKEFK